MNQTLHVFIALHDVQSIGKLGKNRKNNTSLKINVKQTYPCLFQVYRRVQEFCVVNLLLKIAKPPEPNRIKKNVVKNRGIEPWANCIVAFLVHVVK